MRTKLNLTGKIFGKLKVICEEGKTTNGAILWKCQCECGNYRTITLGNLRSGHTKSCGCMSAEATKKALTTHGYGRKGFEPPEYTTWLHIKGRCYNKKNKAYMRYGGRGIEVCESWLESFSNFYEDMGNRPSDKHSLDRFPDNDGNYCKENCRWATINEQSRNKRNNRWFEHGDVRMVMADWAKKFDIANAKLYGLLKKGSFDEVYNLFN